MMKFEPGWAGQAWCSKENEHKVMDLVLCEEIEKIANAKLAEWLKDAPVVYYGAIEVSSDIPNEYEVYGWEDPGLITDDDFDKPSRRAKLVCIEEIKEEK